jgi:putative transposase
VSVPARRSQVTYATGRGLSQRRACTLMGVSRSALACQSARAAKDVPALARMAELSAQYPRYGYRRTAIFLARDGYPMSFGRAHRLWRQARLQVPQSVPASGLRPGVLGPTHRQAPTRCGATISSSIGAPTGRI